MQTLRVTDKLAEGHDQILQSWKASVERKYMSESCHPPLWHHKHSSSLKWTLLHLVLTLVHWVLATTAVTMRRRVCSNLKVTMRKIQYEFSVSWINLHPQMGSIWSWWVTTWIWLSKLETCVLITLIRLTIQITTHPPLSDYEVMCTAHGPFFARLRYANCYENKWAYKYLHEASTPHCMVTWLNDWCTWSEGTLLFLLTLSVWMAGNYAMCSLMTTVVREWKHNITKPAKSKRQ